MISRSQKYQAEALATFCMVFAGTAAIVVNGLHEGALTHVGISLVFGFVVLAMIYTVGPLSGAHMNPAVTVAFWSAGRLPGREVMGYIAAQLAGSVLASACIYFLFGGNNSLGGTLPSGSAAQSFAMESLLTFILMLVIMGVAHNERAEGLMAGVAIGATIAFEALIGGPVSGASMNPARSFGPALVGFHFTHHWIYWVGPLLGAITGVGAYKMIKGELEWKK